MLRRSFTRRFVGSGNTSGGFHSGMKPNIPERAKYMDRWDGKIPADAGKVDMEALSRVNNLMESSLKSMKSGDMPYGVNSLLRGLPQDLTQRLGNMDLSKAFPGGGMSVGMMAFGVGENEKGKKVARAAKMVYDPATGQMKKDFHETQLEPDDVQLPKETVENYDTSNCIEVELEEKPPADEKK